MALIPDQAVNPFLQNSAAMPAPIPQPQTSAPMPGMGGMGIPADGGAGMPQMPAGNTGIVPPGMGGGWGGGQMPDANRVHPLAALLQHPQVLQQLIAMRRAADQQRMAALPPQPMMPVMPAGPRVDPIRAFNPMPATPLNPAAPQY